MRLEVIDLSYRYGPKRRHAEQLSDIGTLKGITFSVEEPSMIAVAGRSGSGKSTLLHVLKGFFRPSDGGILLNGIEPWKQRKPECFDDVGIVFQYPEHQLFANTVYEDIAFGPVRQLGKGDGSGAAPEIVKERVIEAMAGVGLDAETYLPRNPLELSGGEKRKVALAGVLAIHPKLLLLDEPTAGLDGPSCRALFTRLRKLRDEKGITVIWVSHQLSEVLEHASRLLWLDEGRLAADGDPAELLQQTAFLDAVGIARPECFSLRDKLCAEAVLSRSEMKRPWMPHETAQVLARYAGRIGGR